MSVVPNKWPPSAQEAMRALYAREPMTDEQRAERRRLIAREYARNAASKKPSPQLELETP